MYKGFLLPPNTRMQPDAAPRPQDRADFGACFRYNAIPIYQCGAADAQSVGPFKLYFLLMLIL
jgi:hypothetical protein